MFTAGLFLLRGDTSLLVRTIAHFSFYLLKQFAPGFLEVGRFCARTARRKRSGLGGEGESKLHSHPAR